MLTPYGVGVSMFVWVLGRPFFAIDSTHVSFFELNGCHPTQRPSLFNLKLQIIMKKILGLILLCVTMAGATSCTQENDNAEKVLLSKTSYTMYSDATTTIEGSGLTNATWSSDNEFVAVANGNTISSDKVGSTNLYCNGQKISVTVKPSYSL
jgi:hypothetical protein